jgi:hypothetical protein
MKVCQISVRAEEFPILPGGLYNAADQAAAHCFGADTHFSMVTPLKRLSSYDAFFITMWKVKQPDEPRWMDLIYRLRSEFPNKLIILHQEAEAGWWISPPRSLEEQKSIMGILKDQIDIFLAHSEEAQYLNQCFMERGKAYCWDTVQSISFISRFIKNSRGKSKNIGINTFDGRANGITGIAVASKLTEDIIQVNRAWYRDDRVKFFPKFFNINLRVVPILPWGDWLDALSNVYVYLHPMPAAAAGRDTIACAGLGIPVVGNRKLQAQQTLFPELAIDCFDVLEMEHLLKRLLEDDEFFNSMREEGLKRVNYHDTLQGKVRANAILQDFTG